MSLSTACKKDVLLKARQAELPSPDSFACTDVVVARIIAVAPRLIRKQREQLAAIVGAR